MEKHVGSLKSACYARNLDILLNSLKKKKKNIYGLHLMKKKSTEEACGAYENELIFPHFSQEKDYKQ